MQLETHQAAATVIGLDDRDALQQRKNEPTFCEVVQSRK
jgi:hypothetical protein